MFCYQCEQTFRGQGCVDVGVCGKDDTVATLQDLLVHALKGVSMYAHRARQTGAADPEIDAFVVEALFATLTNVNFDPERLASLIARTALVRDQARRLYERACQTKGAAPEMLAGPAVWLPAASIEGLIKQGRQALITERVLAAGPEIANLQELITYGIKGVVAYAQHAKNLGGADPAAYATIHEILDFLTWPSLTVDELVTMALRTGELNYRVMELLDMVNTESLGHPEPTSVRVPARERQLLSRVTT